MNGNKTYGLNSGRCLRSLLLALLLLPALVFAAGVEETFPVLTIGARSFTNVTVTTKAPDYIFILHDAGMTNLKVDKLPRELRIKLGYEVPPELDNSSNAPPKWAQQLVPASKQKEFSELSKTVHDRGEVLLVEYKKLDAKALYAAGGVILLVYFTYCWLCLLICRKAGSPAGALAWIPWLKWIALYRAAGMPPALFLADLIPFAGAIVRIVWSFKICKARGKSQALGIGLIFPISSIPTFLYLALADGKKGKDNEEAAPTRPVFGMAASSQ